MPHFFRSLGSTSLGFLLLFVGLFVFTDAAFSQEGLVVALGDSNTAGWGVGTENAFPAHLAAMLRKRGLKVRVANAGVTGNTFGDMLGRLDASVPAGTRLVIVQGGYNDLIRWTPPDLIVERMKGILSRLRARRIPSVLCGFFRPNWDAIGRKLAAQYGGIFVPGSTCYAPNLTGPDRLHMSPQGHVVVAQRLAPVVASALSGTRKVAAAPQKPAEGAAPAPSATPVQAAPPAQAPAKPAAIAQ